MGKLALASPEVAFVFRTRSHCDNASWRKRCLQLDDFYTQRRASRFHVAINYNNKTRRYYRSRKPQHEQYVHGFSGGGHRYERRM
jgi:hypothetical protein